jgi:hypothetical protein
MIKSIPSIVIPKLMKIQCMERRNKSWVQEDDFRGGNPRLLRRKTDGLETHRSKA